MICPKCKHCADWYIVKTTYQGDTGTPHKQFTLECKLCGYETYSFPTERELNDYFKAHT